jgi:1,4-alpha-glucan branching enzyme
MIKMPRRNVTRFFIPLIDVLILLFCIFLLMEFNSESKVDQQSVDVETQSYTNENLQEELARRTKELQKFEELRPQLTELDRLREENNQLRNANQKNLQQHAFVRVIDIDGKDGSISYFDDARPDQPIRITDAQSAQALIERHTREANGRQLYYYFMYPRTRSIYPLFGQEQEYQRWFAKAANSLVKVGS